MASWRKGKCLLVHQALFIHHCYSVTSLVLGDGDLMVSNPGMIPALRREGKTEQVTGI